MGTPENGYDISLVLNLESLPADTGEMKKQN